MIYSTLFVKEKIPYLEKSEIFLLYVVVISGCTQNAFFQTIGYFDSRFDISLHIWQQAMVITVVSTRFCQRENKKERY